MSIQQSRQPYTPLTKDELKTLDKVLKAHCKELRVQVYSQISQQQYNLDIQRAHMYKREASIADQLRDLADRVESLEEHECDNQA